MEKNKSLKSLFQNQNTYLSRLVLNYIKLILPIPDNHLLECSLHLFYHFDQIPHKHHCRYKVNIPDMLLKMNLQPPHLLFSQ